MTDSSLFLTVDLEDFYHGNYPGYDYRRMERKSSRLIDSVTLMLEVFQEHSTKVTFFVLGEIAKDHPGLIKLISSKGHEIANHGDNHELITKRKPQEVIDGLIQATHRLSNIVGKPILGYRAPNFSASISKTRWLFEALYELGYKYDSSIFPANAYYGGNPNSPKQPYKLDLNDGKYLWEIPVSAIGPRGFRLVWSGGFYWRLLPYFIIHNRITSDQKQDKKTVLYLHPKDIDPQNQSLPVKWYFNWVHQVNTKKGLSKLKLMCEKNRFFSLNKLFGDSTNEENKKR